eukprot:8955138-Pyramimonas_sp.AAC.1
MAFWTDSGFMRVQQVCWFALLKSRKSSYGTITDRQSTAIRLIRGVKSRKQCADMLQDLQTVAFQRGSSLNGYEPL